MNQASATAKNEARVRRVDSAAVSVVETPDWAALIGRAVDDLARIARAELSLFEIKLRAVADAELNRAFAGIVTISLSIAAAIFLLLAIVFGLNERMPLWAACGCTGAIALVAAVTLRSIMMRRAPHLAR
jgi:Putative Actinobacterial Holin-X, holin superfamily III